MCGSGTKTGVKYCDNPAPSMRFVNGEWQRTGKLCPCDPDDPTEISCNGEMATIDIPCNDELCKLLHIKNLLWILNLLTGCG